jgi:hypothetical protein
VAPRRVREKQRVPREIAETADGVTLDLGGGLLPRLSTIDPTDMTIVM